jgi:peroxiredoxin
VFNFSDAELLRSSVYDKAVITFLRNIHASSEEQFISASDSLLHYAGRDTNCRAYMLDHLIDLYATYGPDLALQYLIDRHVVSEEGLRRIDPRLHAKVREILLMSVGRTAPDIQLPTPEGGMLLSSAVARNRATALFFYSSTCDHCHQEMGPLKELHTAFKGRGFDVIGIALDADSAEFRQCIAERALPWTCYSEFKGWGAEAVKRFQVRATPWFYLLDDRLRIVAKPADAAALGAWLAQHLR